MDSSFDSVLVGYQDERVQIIRLCDPGDSLDIGFMDWLAPALMKLCKPSGRRIVRSVQPYYMGTPAGDAWRFVPKGVA